MGYVDRLRTNLPKTVTLVAKATTTVTLNTTTDSSTTVSNLLKGYSSAVFWTSVKANTSADPYVALDGSFDGGSTFVLVATLHGDLTTTANAKCKIVECLPEYSRIRLVHASTTTKVRYIVKATLRP